MRNMYGHIKYKMFSRLESPHNRFCELKCALLLVDSYTQKLFELPGLGFLLEQKFRKALFKPYIGKLIDELNYNHLCFYKHRGTRGSKC